MTKPMIGYRFDLSFIGNRPNATNLTSGIAFARYSVGFCSQNQIQLDMANQRTEFTISVDYVYPHLR
jgi:hypothetical protein